MCPAKCKRTDLNGIILLDKPSGISSNGALTKIKYHLGKPKIGHTGTLDPMASGLLPLCLGRATRFSQYGLKGDKTYIATVKLGIQTDSGDQEGHVILEQAIPSLSKEKIEQCMQNFLGEQKQVPPMHSALKHKGQRLYKLARAGKEVERKERIITIHRLDLLKLSPPELLDFRVCCSAGTYVRTLAEDMAKALGTVGHLVMLRREAVGPLMIDASHTLSDLLEKPSEQVTQSTLIHPRILSAHHHKIELDEPNIQALRLGQCRLIEGYDAGPHQMLAKNTGEWLGIVDLELDGTIKQRCWWTVN